MKKTLIFPERPNVHWTVYPDNVHWTVYPDKEVKVDDKNKVDFTQGLDARFCGDMETVHWINGVNVERLHFAWDNPDEDLLPYFRNIDRFLIEKDRRKRIVYILTNYNSSLDQDLYRIYAVEDIGFDADVRIYDKPHAPPEIRRLQRWCNNRIIHGACKRFEEYKEV